MSSIREHLAMLRDRARVDAYHEALARTVRPGSVVADIGSGTGILALIACKCGARRVYAIEPDDVADLAADLAADNGYADRVQLIRQPSTLVTLPERADVIVADLRGTLPHLQVPTLIDARRRLLAPGGVLVPLRDELSLAPIEAPRVYGTFVDPWDRNPWGLDASPARARVLNSWGRARVGPDQLMAEPGPVISVDYMSRENADLTGVSRQSIRRHGTVHGLSIWLTRTLADGVAFSNSPDLPGSIRASAFFPLSEPVVVRSGDIVEVRFAGLRGHESYVWSWRTTVLDSSGGRIKASFDQSTANGEPPPPPRPSRITTDDVHVDRFILEQMTGDLTVEGIASRVRARFPRVLVRDSDALTRVRRLALRYG